MHLGIIMDGNRRWAQERVLPSWKGHEAGAEVLRNLPQWAKELGIKEFTLFVFSMQNFERNPNEVKFLMKLASKFFKQLLKNKEYMSQVRINFIGQLQRFDKNIQALQQELIRKTQKNTHLKVNFAMGYGGREEIVDGIKKVMDEFKKGKIVKKDITVESFSQYLYLQSEPDLIIRTSGEKRTSNFLIWQSWYSEWFFLDKYWPEVVKEDLKKVLQEFKGRERRFGK